MRTYTHFKKQKVCKYTLRVSLKGSPIPVWRKFEVPSNITLRHLSELILSLFGWYNYHLNCFYVGNTMISPKEQISDDDWVEQYPQENYSLQQVLFVKGKKIKFEYDFGDSWVHEITLSRFDDYKEGEKPAVVFLKGTGACPPEDCGGVWGYEELLDILNRKKAGETLTEDEEGYLEWACWDDDYDPNFIDIYNCMAICSSFSK